MYLDVGYKYTRKYCTMCAGMFYLSDFVLPFEMDSRRRHVIWCAECFQGSITNYC